MVKHLRAPSVPSTPSSSSAESSQSNLTAQGLALLASQCPPTSFPRHSPPSTTSTAKKAGALVPEIQRWSWEEGQEETRCLGEWMMMGDDDGAASLRSSLSSDFDANDGNDCVTAAALELCTASDQSLGGSSPAAVEGMRRWHNLPFGLLPKARRPGPGPASILVAATEFMEGNGSNEGSEGSVISTDTLELTAGGFGSVTPRSQIGLACIWVAEARDMEPFSFPPRMLLKSVAAALAGSSLPPVPLVVVVPVIPRPGAPAPRAPLLVLAPGSSLPRLPLIFAAPATSGTPGSPFPLAPLAVVLPAAGSSSLPLLQPPLVVVVVPVPLVPSGGPLSFPIFGHYPVKNQGLVHACLGLQDLLLARAEGKGGKTLERLIEEKKQATREEVIRGLVGITDPQIFL